MKVSYFFIAALVFFSCTSSQNTSSPDAKRKIEELRTLIHLSPDQAQKLASIEAGYLNKSSQLSQQRNNKESQLTRLKQKRTSSYKKILSHEQFIKFQAIDNDLIKQAPVRFNENK
jgi:predicted RND superfamily exporter protein